MTEWLYRYAWLVPALPAVCSVLIGIGLFSFRDSTRSLREWHKVLVLSGMGLSMALSTMIAWNQISGAGPYRRVIQWAFTTQFTLETGYLIDPLTSIMLVLVTTVALLVMIYSHEYMAHDQGYVRFFGYLSLFTASMLGLVLSPNLVQVYIFWELVGMCSYLLIGFWSTRPTAASACQKAFVTNRVGDFGLLLGILGMYWMTGSFEFQTIADRVSNLLILQSVNPFVPILCSCLFLLGPLAKSAQIPLHVWLPDAMEGPTPISALIHAATMVAAGIFLVARMFPIFDQMELVMGIVAWTGALTALFGATIALTQTDLKKGLAYSTMSQLGYMMMAMGLGGYEASLFHLVTHAYSKALLFLGAGSAIHGMEPLLGWDPSKNQNMFLMGGLRKHLPITGATFLIGALSISGVPPFACFWSKDAILATAWSSNWMLWLIAWSTAGLTGFYMLRIYLLTFEGNLRCTTAQRSAIQHVKPHESKREMTACLAILTVPTVFLGVLGSPYLNWFGQWLGDPHAQEFNPVEFGATAFSSVGVTSLGIAISFLSYGRPVLDVEGLAEQYPSIYLASKSRWHIDSIYNQTWVRGNRWLAQSTLSLDQWWVDAVVNGAGALALVTGEGLRNSESGRIQSYVLGILIGMIALFLFGPNMVNMLTAK
uniref:subunit 5 of NADH-plastoquinone oxidoreductase n=1 Tax=Streptosarcina arenaria TaxID=2058782 RepID=UPI00286A96D1|nr:subunit 5 of NADH-plastoquinone oxidoreductase [Streptosarcina arenaria]WKT08804.1 subunit 5 of NADH-plastoquinone oxidoreductase [Streptosarcina arenaria]